MPRQLILLLSSPPPNLPPFLLFSFFFFVSFYFTPLWCFMDAPSDQRAKVICSARRRECGESGDNVTNQRGEQLTSNCITKRVGCIICLAFFFHGGIKLANSHGEFATQAPSSGWSVHMECECVCCRLLLPLLIMRIIIQTLYDAAVIGLWRTFWLQRLMVTARRERKRQVECWTWTFSCCRNSVTTNQ